MKRRRCSPVQHRRRSSPRPFRDGSSTRKEPPLRRTLTRTLLVRTTYLPFLAPRMTLTLTRTTRRPAATALISMERAWSTSLVSIVCWAAYRSAGSVWKESWWLNWDERREGLASSVFLRCQICGASSGWCDHLPRAGRFYQVNRRSVLAMRVIGRGHTALKKFCGIMDLSPPVAWPAFNGHQKAIAQASFGWEHEECCESCVWEEEG